MSHSAIVVGGGPAGTLLAYILASRDIPVTLIERQSDFAREFRGEGLSPGGQLMFREAGLWDAFAALPHRAFEWVDLYYRGKRIAAIDLDETLSFLPLWVSQPAMLEMLVEKASAFPAFTFRRGVRVAGPIERNGRIVGVELSHHDGEERLEADYVFACDGRFSALRKAAGLDQPRNPESFDVVWCKIPMPDIYGGRPPCPRGYLGNDQLGLFFPAYDDMLQVAWIIAKGTYHDFKSLGIDGWLEKMAEHVSPDLATHLRRHKKDSIHPFLLDVICDCYDRWAVPGMTLVGDAAHPMSPVGAQGINIALRDAVVAANHFVPVLRGDADPAKLDAAADAFHSERLAEVAPIQRLQRGTPKYLFHDTVWLAMAVAILRGLFAIGFIQWVLRRSDARRNPFLYGVTDVRLKV